MRRGRFSITATGVLVALAGLWQGVSPLHAAANTHMQKAAFTTVDPNVDAPPPGGQLCLNGNPGVNCNIYTDKQFVWMNGGPVAAGLGDGTYFFAVLEPGGQGGGSSGDPNDGTAKNLSSPFDPYTNRTFSVSGGVVAYGGTHDQDGSLIRLMPYADTGNPGGVYIMAICSLANAPEAAIANLPGVDPSDCKYDAFKIQACSTSCTPPAAGLPLQIVKDAAGADTNTFTWSIAKDVDRTLVKQSGATATFNYTVSVSHDGGTIGGVTVSGLISVFNPNVDSANNTVGVDIDGVQDQLSDSTPCVVSGGGAQTLTAFETDFPYSCSLSGLPLGQLDNTATVTWGGQFLDNGALLAASDPAFSANNSFTFSSITFTEQSVDDCAAITDTLAGSLGTVCSTAPSPTLLTYSHDVTGTPGTCVNQDNTATFTADTSGTTGSASQTVTLCVGADLGVSKGATPTFTRSYAWSIAKSVDRTLVDQLGGSATFNYTVKVNQTSVTDSAWHAMGSITITNPNDWEAITASVADLVNNGGVCTPVDAVVTVPAGSAVTDGYACTYAAAPSPADGTNTATATWDAAAASTPDGSAQGTAPVNFDSPTTTVNRTITVKDTFNGTTTTLGTVTAHDATPFAAATYTYSHTVSVPVNTCVSYPNTAVILETGQSSSQTVTVCGRGGAGALTMGYWQNKNGQAIISGGKATGGVCNSATWLRQYAPFQDLGATATCTNVATYVANVIKAATCGTSTCNAMLKAQMLATALDVYFSDTALGGNKIGAPAPIGGDSIDLTHICRMIDGSSGTSTCSGVNENVSSAYGGGTCLTVSAMLSYAASQSNVGGTNWYGQNKGTQVLAKDSFDAVNNQVAFAC